MRQLYMKRRQTFCDDASPGSSVEGYSRLQKETTTVHDSAPEIEHNGLLRFRTSL